MLSLLLRQPPHRVQVALLGAVWIALSAGVVVLNKFILSHTPFKHVVSLAFAHMVSAAAFCRILLASCPSLDQGSPSRNSPTTTTTTTETEDMMQPRMYVVAALFAASLCASNAALSRLDVASVQMIKAINPATIYGIGLLVGMEQPSCSVAAVLCLICGGIMYAVQGAMRLQPVGVLLQVLATLADGARHLYIQAALQSYRDQLNPINVLSQVAPVAAAFLWIAGWAWEFPQMQLSLSDLRQCLPLVLSNCVLAFLLNICSYAYIKTTSALTMSVSGIFKDVLMVSASVSYLGSPFHLNQLAGYAIAVCGSLLYKHVREKGWDNRVLLAAAESTKVGINEEHYNDLKRKPPPLK